MLGTACGPELGLPEHLCGAAGARALSRSPLFKPRAGGVPRRTVGLLARPGGGELGGGEGNRSRQKIEAEQAGHPCLGPLSAGWHQAEVAAALDPSRATCAQAGWPGRAQIREQIHSGFQTPGPVPGDSAGGWEASPPTTPAPPRGSLEHCREGSPKLGVARPRAAGRPGPSFPPPPSPAIAPLRCSSPGFAAPAGPLPGCGIRAAAGSVRGAAGAALRPGCIAVLPVPRGATRRVHPAAARPEAAQSAGMGPEGAPGWGSGLRR